MNSIILSSSSINISLTFEITEYLEKNRPEYI